MAGKPSDEEVDSETRNGSESLAVASTTLDVIAGVVSRAGRLRRELAAGPRVAEDGGVELSDVGVDGSAGEPGGEDAAAVVDRLALRDDADAGKFDAEVESSDAGENGDGRELLRGRGHTRLDGSRVLRRNGKSIGHLGHLVGSGDTTTPGERRHPLRRLRRRTVASASTVT